jgi:hypothetical protein
MAEIANLDRYGNRIRNQAQEDVYSVARNRADADNMAFNSMQAGTANPDADNLMEDSAPEDTTMLHMALAGAGMVPGYGIVADLADAALYGMEGDIAGAGLSLISAIPILGLVSGGGRLAKSAPKLKRPVGDVVEGFQQWKSGGAGRRLGAWRGVAPLEGVKQVKYPGIKKFEEAVDKGGEPIAGERFQEALKGMSGEMENVKKLQTRFNLDEDTMADMVAFLKGNDAVRSATQSGMFGGETLLEMQSAIARGARFFYSLDSYTQNQIMQETDSDQPITDPIEL